MLYWMDRAQRARDNLALVYAIEQANSLRKPVICYFAVDESSPMSSPRRFSFILAGIKETACELERMNIPFVSRIESPIDGMPRLEIELDPCLVVVEEALTRYGRELREAAASRISVPLTAIDSEPVVPMRAWRGKISSLAEMRKRASSLWRRHLNEISIPKPKVSGRRLRVPRRIELPETEVAALVSSLRLAAVTAPSPIFEGGPREAEKRLRGFLRRHLGAYDTAGKRPEEEATSGLSAYLHFGQIWAGRVALEVKKTKAPAAAKKAFLENLLVRRELAMNFCFHHPAHYSGAMTAEWAKDTLDAHRNDPRPNLYQREELESAATHDVLWNAAQMELLASGRIHPGLRPLWAKKILQWSASPEVAWETAVFLNDKYALDGCDANGYLNIARCLGGVFERPGKERPIFGRLPYISSEEAAKRIDFADYLTRVRSVCRLSGLPEESFQTGRNAK